MSAEKRQRRGRQHGQARPDRRAMAPKAVKAGATAPPALWQPAPREPAWRYLLRLQQIASHGVQQALLELYFLSCQEAWRACLLIAREADSPPRIWECPPPAVQRLWSILLGALGQEKRFLDHRWLGWWLAQLAEMWPRVHEDDSCFFTDAMHVLAACAHRLGIPDAVLEALRDRVACHLDLLAGRERTAAARRLRWQELQQRRLLLGSRVLEWVARRSARLQVAAG